MTPLLPAITGTLLGRFRIRVGIAADVDACDRIARAQEKAHPSSLGWVMKQSYTAKNHTFHVAEVDGIIRGFVLYGTPTRGKNTGWHVVHALAVQPGFEGVGIGRNLLYSVPTPIRLKCPQTVGKTPRPNAANAFYRNAGMRLAGTEAGKHRALNVWELRRLVIFCAGGNAAYPILARASHQAYGIRSDYAAFDYPFMVDAPFAPDHWNWQRHLRVIHTVKPVMALVRDYGTYDGVTVTRAEMLRQVAALRACGVLRIFVCPKSHGIISDIPGDCGIAISVESQYAGFLPDFRELTGRFVHLLGGTPQQWLGLIPKIEGYGARVVSCDGSSHESGAKKGSHWDWQTHRWNNAHGKKADYYGTIPISGRNVVRILNASDGSAQLPLWVA